MQSSNPLFLARKPESQGHLLTTAVPGLAETGRNNRTSPDKSPDALTDITSSSLALGHLERPRETRGMVAERARRVSQAVRRASVAMVSLAMVESTGEPLAVATVSLD